MSNIFEKELMINNQKGLHARAAAAFVKCAAETDAEVFVEKDGQEVDGSSILSLMMLAASKGTIIKIKTSGNEAQKALDNLIKNKTVFVIAHRLSTIQNADRIAVINEGELVELGTHNELMAIDNGQYKHLYDMQFKSQERA